MMFIKPGISIAAGAGRPAKLGPVFRVGVDLFSVVPHHTFRGETVVKDAGSGAVIGDIVDSQQEPDERGYLDIVDGLRLVKLAGHLNLDPEQIATGCCDPLDCFGVTLFKRAGKGYVTSSIASVDGPFHMSGQGGVVRYHGAFELKNDGAVVSTGDGGAAVSDDQGRLVGLLIGITDKGIFGVPGAKIVEHYWPNRNDVEIFVGKVHVEEFS